MINNSFDFLTLSQNFARDKTLEKYKNMIEFTNFYNTLKEIALSTFKWENLPETVDSRFFEMVLLGRGVACFHESAVGILGLAVSAASNLSIYGYPTKGSCMGMNGKSFNANFYVPGSGFSSDTDRTIICYDNINAYPYIRYIENAAKRLSDIIRTTDVIAENLKQPMIITCGEQSLSSVKAALTKRKDNEPIIFASKGLDINGMKVWENHVSSDNLKVMWEHYYNLESYIKEILGVNSNNLVDKRERLLVDEINANNEATEISIDKRLEQRQLFAERVNKEFGLNIKVSVNKRETEEYKREVEEDDIYTSE